MISLQADNRSLTSASKYSFLNTNYASGVSSVSVLNATDSDFAANVFLLLGNIGSEDAEIVKISTVNSSTGAITLTTNTLFAHSESTRVSVLPYNQIRFFHTTTTTFGTGTPLTGYVDLQVSDWFTSFGDESYSTGYGWYCFYNSVTLILSQPSNYIPYTGFGQSTTEDLLNDFFSMLSNKELRLVTRDDALSWASEGYSRMRNKLNLTNVEYTASAITALSITAGTYEYDLPDDFDHLVAILSGLSTSNPPAGMNLYKSDIEFISLREAFNYKGTTQRYYVRGLRLGFVPTPTTDTTYHYLYLAKAARLSSNTDAITLPNNGVYVVKSWMLYRAYMKFNNPIASAYLKEFTDGLNDMIMASIKRDAGLSSWGITHESNV